MKKVLKPKAEVEKRGRGQPTLYRPELCEQLIDHMSQGYSYESFAGTVPCHRSVLFDWEKAHSEWKEAKDIAVSMNLIFWEKLGIDHILNKSESTGKDMSSSVSLNGSIWIFNMKNRHKWRDKQPDEADNININLSLADRMAKARARVAGGDK